MSDSDSSKTVSVRRSQRIASQGTRSVEGPSFFDLTGEEQASSELGRAMETEEEQQVGSHKAVPKEGEHVSTEHGSSANPSKDSRKSKSQRPPDQYPKLSLKTAYEFYQAMLKQKSTPNSMSVFLLDQGFSTEVQFMKEVEKAGLCALGTVAKLVEANKKKLEESRQEEMLDENENLILNFKPKMGVAANVKGGLNEMFRNKQHKQVYDKMLKRGVINPRSVNFNIIDTVKTSVRETFIRLQLEDFCTDKAPGFAELTAYFYSNLSFLAFDQMRFSVFQEDFDVDANCLADIIGVERTPFIPIKAGEADMLRALKEKGTPMEGGLKFSKLSTESNLLHKIVINCIRPKAASKTDISKPEARLMYALKRSMKFSLPHTIMLHMYGVINKEKGQLPYAGLIYKILGYFNIPLHASLCKSVIPHMVMGDKTLSKMKLRDMPKSVPSSAEKGKRKRNSTEKPAKKKKQKETLLVDEDDNDDIYTDEILEDVIPISTSMTEVRSEVPLLQQSSNFEASESAGVEKIVGEAEKGVSESEPTEAAATERELESMQEHGQEEEQEQTLEEQVQEQGEKEQTEGEPSHEQPIEVNEPLIGLDPMEKEPDVEISGGAQDGHDKEPDDKELQTETDLANEQPTDVTEIQNETLAPSAIGTSKGPDSTMAGPSAVSIMQILETISATQAVILEKVNLVEERLEKVEEEMQRQNAMTQRLNNTIDIQADGLISLTVQSQAHHDDIKSELSSCVKKLTETSQDLDDLRIVRGRSLPSSS